MRPGRLAAALLASALTGQSSEAASLPGAEPLPAALRERLGRATAAQGPGYVPRTRHRGADGSPLYTNRLMLETSPYLLQHAHNPVNWYPWGDDAFETARRLGRPVLLSIGYSTCHWCHVMEEESFEDPEIAGYLNGHYVAVKVDREERPDIDGVYIEAVRLFNRGEAGWPMTLWLTPDREPFHGATYLPPRTGARGARRGLLESLQILAGVWEERRDEIERGTERVRFALSSALAPPAAEGDPDASALQEALDQYQQRFDPEHGGLRGRTKFPSSLPIPLLLRIHRRTGDPRALHMVRTSLDAMRRGGLYDHVGGGFHRYATDPTWTVPHFEKMLYDNALLVSAYTEAWYATGDPAYRDVIRDVLDYVEREMTSAIGTFYSATDADSEGEEGLYFVWTPEQVREAVGAELAPLAIAAFGVTNEGNFEGGASVLRRDVGVVDLARALGMDRQRAEAGLAEARLRMRARRARRVAPLRDEKQVVSWNGLMISALARAGLAIGEADWVERAARAGSALLDRARPGGRLARYLMRGEPHGTGTLDDHAFLAAGLLDLLEATGDPRWLDAAIDLQTELDRWFAAEGGGYFISRSDGEALIAREKPAYDGARPSGNSVAALVLLRLYHLTGDDGHRLRAELLLRSFSAALARRPTALGHMLQSVDFILDTPKEILIVTPDGRPSAEPFLRELRRVFVPNRVLVVLPEAEVAAASEWIPILRSKRAVGGRTTAYVCENQVCDLPADDPAAFGRQIRKPARPYPGAGAPGAEEDR